MCQQVTKNEYELENSICCSYTEGYTYFEQCMAHFCCHSCKYSPQFVKWIHLYLKIVETLILQHALGKHARMCTALYTSTQPTHTHTHLTIATIVTLPCVLYVVDEVGIPCTQGAKG